MSRDLLRRLPCMTGELRRPTALEEDGPSLVIHMRAPLDPLAVQQVCHALRVRLAETSARALVCHVHGPPDVTVIGALARLALLARRLGVPLALRGCGRHLEELLALTGLGDAVRGAGTGDQPF